MIHLSDTKAAGLWGQDFSWGAKPHPSPGPPSLLAALPCWVVVLALSWSKTSGFLVGNMVIIRGKLYSLGLRLCSKDSYSCKWESQEAGSLSFFFFFYLYADLHLALDQTLFTVSDLLVLSAIFCLTCIFKGERFLHFISFVWKYLHHFHIFVS